MESRKMQYQLEDLKVDLEAIQRESFNPDHTSVQESDCKQKTDEELTTKEAIRVVFLLIVMYVMLTALPTWLMMHFLNLSFWGSQGICLGSLILIIWAFGLYKPATKEQKTKS